MNALHYKLKLGIVVLSVACMTLSAQATNGIFFALESGYASQSSLPSASEANATSVDNATTPPALRGSLGYNHDFNRYFGLGINVGMGGYGNTVYHYADGGTTNVRTEATEFLGMLTLHIQQFDLTGKMGGARQSMDVTGENAPATTHRNNPEGAIEGAYNFNRHFAATVTYEHIFSSAPADKIEDIGIKSASVSAILLGIRYTFAS